MAGWYQARQKKKAGVTRLFPLPVSRRESRTTLLRRVGLRRRGGLALAALRLLGLLLAFGLAGLGLLLGLRGVSLRGILRRGGRGGLRGVSLRGILRRRGLRRSAKGRNRENRGNQGGHKLAHLWLLFSSRYGLFGRKPYPDKPNNARVPLRLTSSEGVRRHFPGDTVE